MGSICCALSAHGLLAIFFVQPSPATVPAEPALQWVELTEDAPTPPPLGTRLAPPRSESHRSVNTTCARRAAARAPAARGHEVATEKQTASAHDTPAAGALEDDTGQRAAESAGAGSGRVAPAGGVSDGTLATRAVLVASTAACNGFFPALAASDDGVVTLSMQVTPSGHAHAGRVLDELPLGEGFGDAARRCLQRVRFQPALDRHGQPVASTSVLRLRFARHPGARRRLTAALGH
ncbi:MAG TPA: energy transducer TonB [Polyangiaceae bacterium]